MGKYRCLHPDCGKPARYVAIDNVPERGQLCWVHWFALAEDVRAHYVEQSSSMKGSGPPS